MRQKYALRVMALASAVLGWVGCAEGPSVPVSGVIVTPGAGVDVGSYAPDGTFVDGAGNRSKLSSVYDDATLIAFIHRDCSAPVRELQQAAEATEHGMKIVAVFTDCALTDDQCFKALGGQIPNLVSLCDGKGILSRRYGLAEDANVVFVLDSTGRVRDRGSLAELPSLARKARKVAVAVADTRAKLYGGN